MNTSTPTYTCECCDAITQQPLTFYPAEYPEPAQWVCVGCVEETERLLAELRECSHDGECGCECECGDVAFGTYIVKRTGELVPLCEDCKQNGIEEGKIENPDEEDDE